MLAGLRYLAAVEGVAARRLVRLAVYPYSAAMAARAAMQAHCPRLGKHLLEAGAAVKTLTAEMARVAKSAYGLRGDRYVKPQSPNH
jgi:hypothetical protein